MDEPSSRDIADFLQVTLAKVRELELVERKNRRKDGFKLPAGVYETLEDIGKIEGALAMLKTLWHKDDEFRKASMHLSRLAWDLRKKLHEFLR